MLYQELERQGHRPHIVCRLDQPLHQFAQEQGWRHLPLRFHSQFHLWNDCADIRDWTRWAREQRIDVLHCHRGKDHWLGLPVARLARIPLVRTRHVVTPIHHHLFNRWIYLKATDAIISVSDAARASFGAWRDDLPGGGPVVLAAVDSGRFDPARRTGEWRRWLGEGIAAPASGAKPLWFGLVGRLQNVKGQKYFIRAAAQLTRLRPEARFIIAGAGSESRESQLRKQAAEAGLEGCLRIIGQVEDLPGLLASLDVGVIASIGSEGSSRIALEMMASGLPMVATRVGGIPQLTQASEGVKLVPPRDPGAMAEAMAYWAEHPGERIRTGQENRRHIEQHHQPGDWAAAIVRVYRQAMEH
jgi:glycosyltransferase involved in cell wall biosynthesis